MSQNAREITKKKCSKKGEPLDLQPRKEYHNNPLIFSPRKVREARYRNKVDEREKLEEEAAKADRQQNRANTALQNKLEKERKSKAWREKQEESKRKKAVEAEAEKQRKKEERDAAKPIQSPQLGKRKASQKAAAKSRKKQKPVGDAVGAASVAAVPRTPSPSPTYNSRGRKIKAPKKFK